MRRYEFALLRYVHDVATEEFANVGVVLLDVEQRKLWLRASERYKRLSSFFPDLNGTAYQAMLRHVSRSVAKIDEQLDQPTLEQTTGSLKELLERTLPDDESCFRVSEVMSGVTEAPEARLAELYDEFIKRFEPREAREYRRDDDVRRDVDQTIIRARLHHSVKFEYPIMGPNYGYTFHASWQNGKPQVLEPISLDLVDGGKIVEKATAWSGRLYNLSRGATFAFTGVLAPPQDPTLGVAFDRAMAIFRSSPNVRDVFPEQSTDRVMDLIRQDVDAHAAQEQAVG